MNPNRFQPLDLTAGGLSLGLILVVALVILAGTWEGVRVNINSLDENNRVGPYGPIVFSFSDTVDQALFKSLFSIHPDVPGRFEWSDAKTVRFIPLKPLQPNIDYQVSIKPGVLGKDGLHLRKEYAGLLKVRESRVVYLAVINKKRQLWTVDVNGKSPQQLGNFDKAIYDFDAAPNGEYLIFSAINEKQGADLWYLDRSGISPRLLLDCGADRCTSPAISPDSQQVAYAREAAPLTPSSPISAPRIRVVNIQNGADHPLYADPQVIGFEPGWSPDGKYITSYDGVQEIIQVVAFQTGEQFNLQSVTGDKPSWSPDSKTILFTDIAKDDTNRTWTKVEMANVDTGETSIWIGKNDDQDYQYGELAWSPTSSDIVMGMRIEPDLPSRGLWLTQSDVLGGPMFANDPNYIFNTPKWDMWGTALIFQQIRLKVVQAPEIAVWMPGFNKPQVLAQGSSPHWLP